MSDSFATANSVRGLFSGHQLQDFLPWTKSLITWIRSTYSVCPSPCVPVINVKQARLILSWFLRLIHQKRVSATKCVQNSGILVQNLVGACMLASTLGVAPCGAESLITKILISCSTLICIIDLVHFQPSPTHVELVTGY